MSSHDTGVLSFSSKKSSSSSFVVALLERSGPVVVAEHDVYLFRSGSDKWEVFKKVYVHGANDGSDLLWWSTDAVVPYRRRFLMWVDYYRGMIVADMSSESSGKKLPAPPKLCYVPLPVDTLPVHPSGDCGRGCPEASRCVCATRPGIKFVSVDHQETSSFGLGRMRTWTSTFRITTWSFCDDDYTWRKEATMDPDELWAALDDSEHRFPHVPQDFPVVNMENPDAVCFLLDKSRHTRCGSEPTWMIEVDMKKKVLLGRTVYPGGSGSPEDQGAIKTAIGGAHQHQTFVSTEIPRYMCGGKACKKRRQ
ncbi:hypothetical protein C2845_PM17G03860 [Panicum miliaceum]|uniref:DUF1618 domain-containing protein n=1 Tax=Panicum miliaceum TaxID=4540 RepID=A0A3L6Q143_PANMI|nr:hypothetical protein C2845_PM17G03860 [Panicum miliaceum]